MRNPNFASVFKFNKPKWLKIDLKIIFKFEIRISHTFYTKKVYMGIFLRDFLRRGAFIRGGRLLNFLGSRRGVYSRAGVYSRGRLFEVLWCIYIIL